MQANGVSSNGTASESTQQDILEELEAKLNEGGAVEVSNQPSDFPSTAANTKLDTLHADNIITHGYIDTLETLIGTSGTKLDTLHTDNTVIEGKLDTINGSVDGLETLVTATNTKLDTLHTDVDGVEGSLAHLTDGTQTTRITNGTQSADTVAGDSGQNALLVAGSRMQIAFSTASAQAEPHQSPYLGLVDVSNYRSVSLHITGQGGSSLITFQGSNDAINWVNVSLVSAASGGTANGSTTSSSSAVILAGSLNYRYFRLNVTGIVSGTTAGVLEFSTFPFTAVGMPVNANQSSTWTVQPGNTPNTTPWLVQSSFSYNHISTATTTVVKSGAGILHGISINSLGTVASTITIYDNTAGSGSIIAILDSLANTRDILFDVAFATGLTLVTIGTVAPDVTVSYR